MNLLLTDKSNGSGQASSDDAVAAVGRDIAQLSSTYSKFGYGSIHESLQVMFEELGHCFINVNESSCLYRKDDKSHDFGVIKYDSTADDYAVTPLRVTGDDCSNNCWGTAYDTDYCKSKADDDGDNEADGWAFMYSDCAQCTFYKK